MAEDVGNRELSLDEILKAKSAESGKGESVEIEQTFEEIPELEQTQQIPYAENELPKIPLPKTKVKTAIERLEELTRQDVITEIYLVGADHSYSEKIKGECRYYADGFEGIGVSDMVTDEIHCFLYVNRDNSKSIEVYRYERYESPDQPENKSQE